MLVFLSRSADVGSLGVDRLDGHLVVVQPMLRSTAVVIIMSLGIWRHTIAVRKDQEELRKLPRKLISGGAVGYLENQKKLRTKIKKPKTIKLKNLS